MQPLRNRVLVTGMMVSALIGYFYGCRFEMPARKDPKDDDKLSGEHLDIKDERNFNQETIRRFIEKNGVHLSSKWNTIDRIRQMVSAIADASEDGLNPDDYHLKEIEELLQRPAASDTALAGDATRLETLLTDSFLLLSSHLASGKTDPETIYPVWKVPRRRAEHDLQSLADSAIESGRISEAIHNLLPSHPDYLYLKSALVNYRHLKEEGGWRTFTTSMRKLEYGMRHPDVDSLRRRLAVTQGYIKPDSADADYFDKTLYDQVVIFQERNGLDPDGVVGKSTIEALNIPVDERIETIEANLERWRWISDNLGERYIRVNIADFKLRIIENDSTIFESPAIVGRQYRETPVFGAVMKYLILNPEWVVPPTILTNDVIPAVIKDQSYLAKNDMKVLRMDGSEVDPSTIDWNNTADKGFPYMIRQEPGIKCPLGKIKFMFPNEYNVYIHDTPSLSLFQHNIRTFSSGCIRISNAFELAEYLLKDDPMWSLVDLQKEIDKGEQRIVVLKNPLPVYILYLTAWADENGTAWFGKDVYDRDRELISALKKIEPESISKRSLQREIQPEIPINH